MTKPLWVNGVLAAAVVILAAGSAGAVPIPFYGLDAGVGPGGARPLSDAAAAAFDLAAPGLALEDFEGQPTGTIPPPPGQALGGGLSVEQPGDGLAEITSSFPGPIIGYNTTSGGSQFLRFSPDIFGGDPQTMSFVFSTPVSAFGAYFTGVGTASGSLHLLYTSGMVQDLAISGDFFGGVLFFGFTDIGASISQIDLELQGQFLGDVYGVDDVRFGNPVPEPGTMILMGLGLLGLGRRFRRRA